jgi:hypothetical protein
MNFIITSNGGQVGRIRWKNTISFNVLPAGELAFISMLRPVTIWGTFEWL